MGNRPHLDISLGHLGLSPTDDERPILRGVRETEVDGAYTLILNFESLLVPFETWENKARKNDEVLWP